MTEFRALLSAAAEVSSRFNEGKKPDVFQTSASTPDREKWKPTVVFAEALKTPKAFKRTGGGGSWQSRNRLSINRYLVCPAKKNPQVSASTAGRFRIGCDIASQQRFHPDGIFNEFDVWWATMSVRVSPLSTNYSRDEGSYVRGRGRTRGSAPEIIREKGVSRGPAACRKEAWRGRPR
ncbi:hypothetical protein EYF80_020640 [Liparis tanakae]|uniref:Uncharacterized protein n=1 Tax=Liparis tanakae TaxID=230148 RepID=A0A4Z2HW29_9TELE|nr:hypothetical protein EYF80_020640 [Liparis tanakae]